MEYYNNILCANSCELIRSGDNPHGFTSYSNLNKMCTRSETFGKGKGSPLLIKFSSLPPVWQEKLKKSSPSPEFEWGMWRNWSNSYFWIYKLVLLVFWIRKASFSLGMISESLCSKKYASCQVHAADRRLPTEACRLRTVD